MKESIIITGASGLLGTAIAIGLSEKYQIIGIDRTSTSQKSIFDHFFEADLTDESSIKNCIAAVSRHNGKKVAAVIHLAAYYDFSGAPSPLYQELTVNGTVLLLEHLQVQGFEVGQYVRQTMPRCDNL